MDRFEIAHSITVEAIRAGVNRPDEITSLFERIAALAPTAVLASPPAVEEPEEELSPLAPPALEPLAEAIVEEPRAEPPPPKEAPNAHLSPEQIAASHGDDFINCLECGKKLRQIRRHLLATHNLTPEAYFQKWGLPGDYPVVAPAIKRSYSERAKKNYATAAKKGIGLAAATAQKRDRKADKTRKALIG